MASFVRQILTSLTYEPSASDMVPARDGEALSKLEQRLTSFVEQGTGTRATISIQPGDCMVWDGNPRDQPGLNPDSCRSLIDSIATEGGNRIPVLVRLAKPEAEAPYELLVGSRRRFAIDWLNHNGRSELRLNALVVDLSDEEAFRLADIENRERADITELDRARSYQSAVDRFYGGVQSRMAESLNLSNSQLSRLLGLAQLPAEVVAAFATKEELRVRHSEVLTPLLRRADTRACVIAEALVIGEEQQRLAREDERMLPAATVLQRLKEAATPSRPAELNGEAVIMAAGAAVGRVRTSRTGELQIDLTVAETADVEALLASLREAILTGRANQMQLVA
ncbi:MAG TPA: ParB/RepB/Spo0J family partition protein [Sphingobium sp.]|nr:ParB/RepB/Spo0J family partition protein [Sphingobium sp.]